MNTKDQSKARASQPHQATSDPRRSGAFATSGFDALLATQRNSAEAVAAAYRKAFEGWARILTLQSDLARSLYERGAGIGTELYRHRDRPDGANAFVEATQGAAEDIVRTTQKIVDTACACCVDAAKVYGEYAGKQGTAVHEASPSGLTD